MTIQTIRHNNESIIFDTDDIDTTEVFEDNGLLYGELEYFEHEGCYIKHFNYVDHADGTTTYDVYRFSPDFKEATIISHQIILEDGEDTDGSPCTFEDDIVVAVRHNAFTAATINHLLATQCDPAYPIDYIDVVI